MELGRTSGNQKENLKFTDKNAEISTSLLASCNSLVIRMAISGCVRMACDSLLITSLLQVVNRLVAS